MGPRGTSLLPPPPDPVFRVLEEDSELREAGPDRVRGREVLPLPRVLAELHEEVQDPRENPVRGGALEGRLGSGDSVSSRIRVKEVGPGTSDEDPVRVRGRGRE